jgi:DNA polymerase-3 subunit epsilon/ATP-dependent DNA helicase DinG
LEEASELCLGSPFDYQRAALLCLPTDMPEPTFAGYPEAAAEALRDLATAANGHTMALFTSHAAVRATAQALRQSMAGRGVRVLAQGVDGSPQQLLARFQHDPRAVLLGTSSFWEGVDIGNGALKVLVVARLPFSVPTDPVFAARSELYDQPFTEYALPQAVLRFRQGFGRLIRSKSDRGAVVVLDKRVRAKAYGSWFLASVPPATRFQGPMSQVVAEVRRWLARPSEQTVAR